MDIRPVGNDLEAVCAGCGEVLLIGSGDSVNYRMGPPMEVGGIMLPMPSAILCHACSKKENPDMSLSMKFAILVCADCGEALEEEDEFNPELDENGNLKKVLCRRCSELWRT